MNLGDIILNYRNSFSPRMSQRDFAKKCGLSHTYIAALEKNIDPRTNKPIAPTLDTVKYIAKGVNMSIEEILKMLDDEQAFTVNEDISINNLEKDNTQTEIRDVNDIDVAFSSGLKGLNKENQEIAKSIIEGLLAKQKKEEEEKKKKED